MNVCLIDVLKCVNYVLNLHTGLLYVHLICIRTMFETFWENNAEKRSFVRVNGRCH